MTRIDHFFIPLVLLLVAASAAPARGPVILLKNGGRLEGEVIGRQSSSGERTAASYVVRLLTGARIKIDGRQIRKIVEDPPALKHYDVLLNDMPDTGAGHWAMAKWCKEQSLVDQAVFHQQQVVRLEPEHEGARRALGYTRLHGRWTRPEEYMQQQGYVRYKGAWRLPQQIALLEKQRETELAEKDWRRKIKVWRGWLDGRRRDEAKQSILQIKDPQAVPALGELLASEASSDVRELYVSALGRIRGPSAIPVLISTAMNDKELEVRIRALDLLREFAGSSATRAFAEYLGSKDNRMVNRAGVALGRLGDKGAILPLIDALVTRHETIVASSGGIRPSFSRGGGSGSGLSVGGGPKKIVRQRENRSVLEALVSLTHQNYQYSKRDWKDWYIRQRKTSSVNLRRDS